jgi:hypothetical protein
MKKLKLSRPERDDLFAMFRLPVFRQIQWTAAEPQHVSEQLQDLFEHCSGDLSAMASALLNAADAFPTATVAGLCLVAKQRVKER